MRNAGNLRREMATEGAVHPFEQHVLRLQAERSKSLLIFKKKRTFSK